MALFSTLKQAMAVPPPKDGKPYTEAWASFQPGFGIRVLPDESRCWISRYRKPGHKSDTKERLLDIPVDGTKKTFELAKDRAAEAKSDAKGTGGKGGISLATAYESYIEVKEDLAKDTLTGYENSMARLSDKAKYTPLSALDDNFWQAEWLRMKGKSISGAKASLRLVHAILKREVRKGTLARNPLSLLADTIKLYARGEPVQTWIPSEHMPFVWRALNLLHPSVRDYLLVLLFTGWRKSVAGALEWSKVSKDRRTYLVDKSERGNKAKKTMEMPIPDILWNLVFAPRLAVAIKDEVWVIPSTKKIGLPIHEPRGSFDILEAKTGLKLSAHPFRRTFITTAEKTVGLLHAAVLAMHSPKVPLDLKQTAAYVMIEHLKASSNKVAEAILTDAGVPIPEKHVPTVEWRSTEPAVKSAEEPRILAV